MTISHRARTYTEYNEEQSAWGYFDSQDLAEDDEEEDELYEDEPGGHHRMQDQRPSSLGGHANGHAHDRGEFCQWRD